MHVHMTHYWLWIESQFKSWRIIIPHYCTGRPSFPAPHWKLWNWKTINCVARHLATQPSIWERLLISPFRTHSLPDFNTIYTLRVIKINVLLAIYLNYIESFLVGTPYNHSFTKTQKLWKWWEGSVMLERMVSIGAAFLGRKQRGIWNKEFCYGGGET